MYVFGEIDKSSKIIERNVVNYTNNLTSASSGIQSYKIVSASNVFTSINPKKQIISLQKLLNN